MSAGLLYAVATTALVLVLAMGLARALIGPTLEDRMLAAQLIGSTGVAILVLWAGASLATPLLDVAVVLALLAAVATAALTRTEAHND